MYFHITDTAPLATRGLLLVLPDSHDVVHTDGSQLALHRIVDNGAPSRDLRGVLDGEHLVHIIDVRRLAPLLRAELCAAPARDVDGLIGYTLRQRYPNARELRATVRALADHTLPLEREPEQRPLQFLPSTGHADALGPDNGDRRFWPIHL